MFACHIDLKRAMWKPEYLKEYVKHLKKLGYTHILLEVEDKFRFKNHPEIAHPEAFGHEQYREIVRELRGEGLDVIPLWQTLGHAEAVLRNPGYSHLREHPGIASQYDPVSEEARSLLVELIDELIDVFEPAEFFHLGGDEAKHLAGSEKLKPLAAKIGVGGVFMRHMLPLFEHVLSRGLKPVVWADMVLTHPGMLENIPKEAVLAEWDYFTSGERTRKIRIWGSGFYDISGLASLPGGRVRELVRKYAVDPLTRKDGTFRGFFYAEALRDMGFQTFIASASRCAGDSMGTPENSLHLPNVFHAARKSREFAGGIVTSWAVRHNHPETQRLANFIAAAGRRRDSLEYDEPALAEDYTEERFGLRLPEFYDAMKSACVTWQSAQASRFPGRFKALSEGRNPFTPDIEELTGEGSNVSAARERLLEIRRGYESAAEKFASMAGKAKKNQRELFFWLEGVEYNLFHADCVLASIDPGYAGGLKQRLRKLRRNTERLFSETYEPAGAADEVNVRYGFFEDYLKSL